MPEQIKNSGLSTLSGSVDNTTDPVTFSVADGSLFPSSGNFRLKIDDEILLATSRTGNSITATRAQESTTIASHSSGAQVKHPLTAGAVRQLYQDYLSSGTFASRPTAGIQGRVYLPTDTPWITHSYDNGSTWENFYNGLKLESPPTASWTTINSHGSLSRTDEKDSIKWSASASIDATTARGFYRATPATPYKITVGVTAIFYYATTIRVSYFNSSDLKTSSMVVFNSTDVIRYTTQNETSTFSVFSSTLTSPTPLSFMPVLFFQLENNGTNRYYRVSQNGVDFTEIYSTTSTSHLTPDAIAVANYFPVPSVFRLVHYKVE
jgi:hypothetical protein